MDYAFLSAKCPYQSFQVLMGFLLGGIYTKDGGEKGPRLWRCQLFRFMIV